MKQGSLSLIGAMIGCLGFIISSKELMDILWPFGPYVVFIFRLAYVVASGILCYLSFKLLVLNLKGKHQA